MKPAESSGDEVVTKAVMRDPVTKAAIEHSASDPSPSRVAASEVAATRVSDALKLRTGSQRRINLVWELTQAIVTVMVVGATLFIAGSLALSDAESNDNRAAAFLLLSNGFFMIVTAYYQRTNHTRTGGVGGRDVETDR